MKLIRTLIVGCILMSCHLPNKSLAQVYRIEGYHDVFERRFAPGAERRWLDDLSYNMEELIGIVTAKSNKLECVVPLQFVKGGDTLVCFFYSKELKSKKKPIRWVNAQSALTDKSFYCVAKRDIKLKPISYDSVATIMRENIVINSAIFNMDKYLANADDINSLCFQARTNEERLHTLYAFFINGVLLSEDRHTNSLYYFSY